MDEGLQTLRAGKRLRERGRAPRLADSEVLTMEVVAEYLGLEQGNALFTYFHRHLHTWPSSPTSPATVRLCAWPISPSKITRTSGHVKILLAQFFHSLD